MSEFSFVEEETGEGCKNATYISVRVDTECKYEPKEHVHV